jgi:hypothetical protein
MTEILLDTQPAATNGVATPAGTASPPAPAPSLQTPTAGIAEFEGATVASAITKVTGTTAVDAHDVTLSIDDVVRVVGEFQVARVTHEIDKDGQLVRVQYVKPRSDLSLVPWNPADPNDVGIIRARHP